jgi:hypothetical protein
VDVQEMMLTLTRVKQVTAETSIYDKMVASLSVSDGYFEPASELVMA